MASAPAGWRLMTAWRRGAILALALLAGGSKLLAAGTPLIDAIRARDGERVRALLKGGADVNAAPGDGATALHWAVHLDDAATVDLLLRSGARANAANDLGVTPLYISCTNRNGALTERLLAAGADAKVALPNGETVLMNCARTGSALGVRALLASGADPDARESTQDQTALMWAAAQRHPESVAALLRGGANVALRTRVYQQTVTSEVTQRAGREELNYQVPRGGTTALLFAARSGDAESARLLVEAGADVNDALPNGTPAVTLAAHSGHGAVAAALLEKGAEPDAAEVGYSAMHAAVLRRDLDLVRTLLKFKANPDARITRGTPMRRTSQDFDLPAVLIGATPFALAAKFLETDMVRDLAAAGADTRTGLPDGSTPLMLALGQGVVNNADRRGLSILDGGVIESEDRVLSMVEALVELKADLGAVTKAGDSVIHVAAQRGYDRAILFLAEKGAPLSLKNARGLTPLGTLTARRGAQVNDRASTVKTLLSLGALE
jgi:ankyrin repeat protein